MHVWLYAGENTRSGQAGTYCIQAGGQVCVHGCHSVCTTSNRINLSFWRKLDRSYSPPSLGGEGISGAGGVKGQAKLSARLGGRVGLAGYSKHPPRALSHSH